VVVTGASPDVRPWRLLAALAAGTAIWLLPPPGQLSAQTWHLFALFTTAILAILIRALPILTASLLAMTAAVLTRTLTPVQAFSGFSQDFLLLIVAAFLVSRAVIRSGLGRRIAFLIIRSIGKSTLGLAYSITFTDALIAPAFPSNTARSGVLFPILQGLASPASASPRPCG